MTRRGPWDSPPGVWGRPARRHRPSLRGVRRRPLCRGRAALESLGGKAGKPGGPPMMEPPAAAGTGGTLSPVGGPSLALGPPLRVPVAPLRLRLRGRKRNARGPGVAAPGPLSQIRLALAGVRARRVCCSPVAAVAGRPPASVRGAVCAAPVGPAGVGPRAPLRRRPAPAAGPPGPPRAAAPPRRGAETRALAGVGPAPESNPAPGALPAAAAAGTGVTPAAAGTGVGVPPPAGGGDAKRVRF